MNAEITYSPSSFILRDNSVLVKSQSRAEESKILMIEYATKEKSLIQNKLDLSP